jgi:hypothetical protein
MRILRELDSQEINTLLEHTRELRIRGAKLLLTEDRSAMPETGWFRRVIKGEREGVDGEKYDLVLERRKEMEEEDKRKGKQRRGHVESPLRQNAEQHEIRVLRRRGQERKQKEEKWDKVSKEAKVEQMTDALAITNEEFLYRQKQKKYEQPPKISWEESARRYSG